MNTQTDAGILHARAGLADRWDIAVSRDLPSTSAISRSRYAAQVRQDIWRALQDIRGFVPRVLVQTGPESIQITGGGTQVTGRTTPGMAARIAHILDNPDNRRRWANHARARANTVRGDPCSTRS